MREPSGGARYEWFGWRLPAPTGGDQSVGRLTETHEYFHRQLDDTTAFGGLTKVAARLAERDPHGDWATFRDDLVAMANIVHEAYAVGMSLLTTQRAFEYIEGYPLYDRSVDTVRRLIGVENHPWVALAALRAAATACMQSTAIREVLASGLDAPPRSSVARTARPNERLVALLRSRFDQAVARAQRRSAETNGGMLWWIGSESVALTPESMDGDAGAASEQLHRDLLAAATTALAKDGCATVDTAEFRTDLQELILQARKMDPTLDHASVSPTETDDDLLFGGALDSQRIAVALAPQRATLLPYGSASGLSGSEPHRHGFVTVTTPAKVRRSYELSGIAVPNVAAFGCLRTTIFDEDRRDSILLVVLDDPEQLDEPVPVYVAISSSAAAVAPDVARAWMHAVPRDRLSLVMDTPATSALRRWCASGDARFRTATRTVELHDAELRIIAGRIEDNGNMSPLVVIPTTEFGARWFESAIEEDDVLRSSVVEDPSIFEEESAQLDVLLPHLLLEEPVIGTASWNA